MPDIPLPIGLVAKFLTKRFDQHVLLGVYVKSHRDYMRSGLFLRQWDKLGDHLEVSTDIPTVLDGERPLVARIAIRAGGRRVPFAKVLVTAQSYGLRFQDVVEFHHVSDLPTIGTCPSIPLRSLDVTDEGHILAPSLKVSISLIAFEGAGLDQELPAHVPDFEPTTIDLLNDRWVYKWGRYWNLAAVDSEIRALDHRIRYALAAPRVLTMNPRSLPWRVRLHEALRYRIGRPVAFLLTRPAVLQFVFWMSALRPRRPMPAQ